MYEAVIFDCCEVRLTGLKASYDSASQMLGVDRETVRRQLMSHITALFKGRISEDEYWAILIRENGWNCGIGQLKDMVRDNFREIPGTKDLIARVKHSGYKLGLLSDHAREWVEFCLAQFGHHEYFDTVKYSYELGMCKPHFSTFFRAAAALGTDPKRCIVVDDREANILALNHSELGMRGIVFESAEQVEAELETLLFLR